MKPTVRDELAALRLEVARLTGLVEGLARMGAPVPAPDNRAYLLAHLGSLESLLADLPPDEQMERIGYTERIALLRDRLGLPAAQTPPDAQETAPARP